MASSGARSAKLAAFFNDEDEDDGSSLPVKKDIEELKLAQFSHGINKKSKREKEKEAAEAKKLQEEQEAAIAYAEFVNAFDSDTTAADRSAAFVRAGEAPPTTSRNARVFSMFEDEQRTPPPVTSKPRGKRAMDTYLEQIKREQSEREARLKRQSQSQGKSVTSLAAMEALSGSRDRGDAETSNLFVANLPMHITEAAFGNFFSQHGPVGSVKIMWPRLDPAMPGPGTDINQARRNKSAGLSGFVSFLKRRDAEKALNTLDGFDWGGSILRVGWSKAVPVASKAAYDARGASQSGSRDLDHGHERDHERERERDRRRSRSRSRSKSPGRSHSRRHESRYSRSRSPPRRRSRSRSRSPRRHYSRSRSRSPRRHSRSRSPRRSAPRSWRDKSRSPSRTRSPPHMEVDAETEGFMRMVVGMIKDHGRPFEAALRERENGKPQFAFLWDENSPFYYTFRRLLDSDQTAHKAFDDDGGISVYSTDSAEESEREHGPRGRLGTLARKRFEVMLRALTGKRGEIGRCMVFSLDHAEAASEIADIITSSLLVDSTAVPRKVARLFLICDILHNSAASVPFAWKFRQEFQGRLGLVFDHFSTIYHSFPGRITAETFKKQITSVIDVWEDWIVFPPDFTTELRSRLDGREINVDEVPQEVEVVEEITVEAPVAPRFKASSFKPAAETMPPPADIDGEPLDDVDGEPMDDVDGEPLNADVDGEPLPTSHDVDGEPLDEDLDGAPLLNEDVDGASLADEDLDGAPIATEDLNSASIKQDGDTDNPPLAQDDDDDNMSLDSDAGRE